MRYLLIVAMLFLAGCNDTRQVVTTYKHLVVHPDEAMYYCPVLKEFPKWQNLTDSQVAKTIIILHKNNITCYNSIQSIKKFFKEADKTINKQ